MKDTLEAMEAALEALTCHETYFKHPAGDRAHKAIVMLRTAIAATADAQPAVSPCPGLVKVFGCYDAAQIPLEVRGVYQIDGFTTGVYVQMPSSAAAPAPDMQPVADLRCAKWLDPECADAGACQSLRFKSASDGLAWALGANAQLVEALREAEEYIAQHSQANGYGLLDHDHDRYERLPLLERLSAALSAAEAAQKGTT